MKIEKFLEKISQDERVEKVDYIKNRGYSVMTKNEYGVIREYDEYLSMCDRFVGYANLKRVVRYFDSGSQSGIEYFLENVGPVNEQEIKNENNKVVLGYFEKATKEIQNEIERTERRITDLKTIKLKHEKEVEKLKKEVEAYGTTEQL